MQLVSRLLAPLFRLQWRLTLSYTITTTLVLLSIFVVSIAIALAGLTSGNMSISQLLEQSVQTKASQAVPLLRGSGRPDQAALDALLGSASSQAPTSLISYHGFLAVLDKEGNVITSLGDAAPSAGSPPETYLAASDVTLLRMLADGLYPLGMVHQEANNTLVALAPILDKNRSLGMILMKVSHVQLQPSHLVSLFFTSSLLRTFLIFLVSTGIAGTVFGFVSTRGIARRFKKLFSAADSWSQGDFSVFVQDTSRDELGQLARQLSRMAEQLQNLLQTSQKLAMLEERNRLARDLHDSVKQHLFVIALQMGTAKKLLGQSVEKVEHHLTEAEQVLRQVEQELVVLIHQLRPAALEEKGLAVALREFLLQWRRQTGIAAHLQVEGDEHVSGLSSEGEEVLFRVAQEALSNVVRHSRATSVDVHLVQKSSQITLSISDDGRGFDSATTAGKGVGLRSMQERMRTVGGELQIESVAGQGTRVIACYAHGSDSEKEDLRWNRLPS